MEDSTNHIVGKSLIIGKTPAVLFPVFTDLTLLKRHYPSEYDAEIEATQDTLKITVKGQSFGIRIKEKSPFSLVSFEGDESVPFPVELSFHFEPVGLDSTQMHIELDTKLNTMLKMMIGSRLQGVVDKLTSSIENAVNQAKATLERSQQPLS